MAKIKEYMDQITFKEDLASGKLVLADFYAVWCQPCKLQHPVLEEAADIYGDKIIIGRINIDINPSAARAYDVSSIPTLIFLKDGMVKKICVGYTQKKQLCEIIDELLKD